jgi:glycogen debranching enzyme
VISSNAAHALWAGIAEKEKARQTAERLMSEDMFSGWGVRTLSTWEQRYNPVGYHLGTVWPHDNAIVAAGFRRYGFDEFALKIFTGMVEAAMHFDNTLPELFCGFPRDQYGAPVRYLWPVIRRLGRPLRRPIWWRRSWGFRRKLSNGVFASSIQYSRTSSIIWTFAG